MVLWLRFLKLIKNSFYHGRIELLGRKSITACNYLWNITTGLSKSCYDIQVKRISCTSGLFGPVKNSDLFYRFWHLSNKIFYGEWSVKPNNKDTNFFIRIQQGINSFSHGTFPGSHDHNHFFSFRMTFIIKEVIPATCVHVKFVHNLLNDLGHILVILISRFACLEEHIGVLGSSADHRTIGIKGAFFVLHDLIFGHHCLYDIIRNSVNL